MDTISLIVGSSWTFVGLLIIALSIPLVRGKIKPNRFYGVRFRQSYLSDEAWYAINRFGGKRLIVWSAILVIAGIVCLFLPLRSHTGLAIAIGYLPAIVVLIPSFQAWRFAQRFS